MELGSVSSVLSGHRRKSNGQGIVPAADSLASFKNRLKNHLFNQKFRPTCTAKPVSRANAIMTVTTWQFINYGRLLLFLLLYKSSAPAFLKVALL